MNNLKSNEIYELELTLKQLDIDIERINKKIDEYKLSLLESIADREYTLRKLEELLK